MKTSYQSLVTKRSSYSRLSWLSGAWLWRIRPDRAEEPHPNPPLCGLPRLANRPDSRLFGHRVREDYFHRRSRIKDRSYKDRGHMLVQRDEQLLFQKRPFRGREAANDHTPAIAR